MDNVVAGLCHPWAVSQVVHDLFPPNQLAQPWKSLQEVPGGYAANVGIRGQLQNTVEQGINGGTENVDSPSLRLRGHYIYLNFICSLLILNRSLFSCTQ